MYIECILLWIHFKTVKYISIFENFYFSFMFFLGQKIFGVSNEV